MSQPESRDQAFIHLLLESEQGTKRRGGSSPAFLLSCETPGKGYFTYSYGGVLSLPPTKDLYHFAEGRERWERGILGVETC